MNRVDYLPVEPAEIVRIVQCPVNGSTEGPEVPELTEGQIWPRGNK